MARASEDARAVDERTRKRLEENAAKRKRDDDEIAQLAIAIRIDKVLADARPDLLKKAHRVVRHKRQHLTKEEHAALLELCLDMNQSQAAAKLGISKSTVCRHLSRPTGRVERRGSKPKIRDEMKSADARFMFLTQSSNWTQCATFINKAFRAQITPTLARQCIKEECAFRHGDFHRFPRGRNTPETIELRHCYAMDMPDKYSPHTLFEAIYYDEMCLCKNMTTGAWIVRGWPRTDADDTLDDEEEEIHLSLLVAASPQLRVIHFDIVDGAVNERDVPTFFQDMIARFMRKCPREKRQEKRALIMDKTRMHEYQEVVEFLNGSVVSQKLGFEYLPPASPFLNPVEGVFACLKRQLWVHRAEDTASGDDRFLLKKRMVESIALLERDRLVTLYDHVEGLLTCAREKTAVSTPQLYAATDVEDNAGACPMMSEPVETLLKSYLVHEYEEFTVEQHALVEQSFGVKRLTLAFVEDGGAASAYGAAPSA